MLCVGVENRERTARSAFALFPHPFFLFPFYWWPIACSLLSATWGNVGASAVALLREALPTRRGGQGAESEESGRNKALPAGGGWARLAGPRGAGPAGGGPGGALEGRRRHPPLPVRP